MTKFNPVNLAEYYRRHFQTAFNDAQPKRVLNYLTAENQAEKQTIVAIRIQEAAVEGTPTRLDDLVTALSQVEPLTEDDWTKLATIGRDGRDDLPDTEGDSVYFFSDSPLIENDRLLIDKSNVYNFDEITEEDPDIASDFNYLARGWWD